MKREVKSWKAMLITILNMNILIYIYVSISNRTLILRALLYLEIATINYYALNRLGSLARTLFFFLIAEENYDSSQIQRKLC